MHLKQPGFTYSACGPFPKNKERMKNFYQNKLDQACFSMIWLMEILKILEKSS